MGIQNFGKVFKHQGEIKYKDLKGKTMAIDAMYQLHRMAHPFKSTATSKLTAPDGTSTNHINGLLALILNLHKYKSNQVWIFDNPEENPIKANENKKRQVQKEIAAIKLGNVLNNTEDANKYERAAFKLERYMIHDLKYILNCFDIPWIEAPSKYEAEHIAAYLTNAPIDGIKVDGVISTDPDCLLFGARLMIKNHKGKLYRYNLKMVLSDAGVNQSGLIKIGVALGCDFADKTPGIGPISVLKKIDSIELTDEQKLAAKYFETPLDEATITSIHWNNHKIKPFKNTNKINELLEWIVNIKGFDRDRIIKRFTNAKIKLSTQ